MIVLVWKNSTRSFYGDQIHEFWDLRAEGKRWLASMRLIKIFVRRGERLIKN